MTRKVRRELYRMRVIGHGMALICVITSLTFVHSLVAFAVLQAAALAWMRMAAQAVQLLDAARRG